MVRNVSHFAPGETRLVPTCQGATGRGTPTILSAHRQIANRMRKPNQRPQVRLRLGPDPIDTTEGARIWPATASWHDKIIKIGVQEQWPNTE
jgi:hypothetical protein